MLSQPPTFALIPSAIAIPRSAKGCAMVPPECWRMPRKKYADVKSEPVAIVSRLVGAVASGAWGVVVAVPAAAGAEDGPAALCARAGVARSPATHTPHTIPAIVLMHPP